MQNIKYMKHLITLFLLLITCIVQAQKLSLDAVLKEVQQQHPSVKMYDAEIQSMDEAAKGARSWMAPEFAAGFYQTPYNVNQWKAGMNEPGMGMFMVSGQQIFPNKKKQDADAKYMEAMSSVVKEKKAATLNDLYAAAKSNYYDWMMIKKKIAVLQQNEGILSFMIRNAEIRYQNGLEKVSAYYKAKAAMGNVENMKVMLENEAVQKRIVLNTLMNRDKNIEFDIDSIYNIKAFPLENFDSVTIAASRSDIRSIDKDISVTYLQRDAERAKLKPEFGIRYDHMFAWAQQPWQFSLMGMIKIPMKWSTKMNYATMESLKWKAASLEQEKKMVINEATGMATGIRREMEVKEKQLQLFEHNIIPALQKNFQTMQLGYEQNTEELFMLYDAWETLNMTQLEYVEQLRQLLQLQVELEKVLEKN
ncbi:MAG: TolC family protein [Bacteroidota bacterium]|nr:TolC family protein [Bacteroidota bacterium]